MTISTSDPSAAREWSDLYWIVPGTIACLAFIATVRDPFALDILVTTLLWAAAASAWNLSGGYAGQLSIGHAAYYGIGAYTSTYLMLSYGLSPWIGMFFGAGLAALTALGIGALTVRLRGSFFVMATLAFGAIAHIVAAIWRSVTGGSNGLSIPFEPSFVRMVFPDKQSFAILALALLLIVVITVLLIERSKLGASLVAYREDDAAARALGVRTLRARLIAIMISALFTAICGTIYAQYTLYIDPDSVTGLSFSLQVALICIVGGVGTLSGPILGAALIIPLASLLRGALSSSGSGLHLVVYAVMVILVLLTLPEGIGPSLARRLRAARGK